MGKGPRLGEGGSEFGRAGGASPWKALWTGRMLWEGAEGVGECQWLWQHMMRRHLLSSVDVSSQKLLKFREITSGAKPKCVWEECWPQGRSLGKKNPSNKGCCRLTA